MMLNWRTQFNGFKQELADLAPLDNVAEVPEVGFVFMYRGTECAVLKVNVRNQTVVLREMTGKAREAVRHSNVPWKDLVW